MSDSHDTLLSLSKLPRYGGLFPFHISEDGGITLSTRWLIWTAIFQIAQTSGVTFLLVCYPFPFKQINAILTWLFFAQILALQISMYVHLFWLILKRDCLNNALTNIMKIDKATPLNIKISRWYPQIFHLSLLLLFFVQLGFNTDLYRTSFLFTVTTFYSLAVNYFQATLNCIAIIQFTRLLNVFRSSFEAITTYLRQQSVAFSDSTEKLLEQNDILLTSCEEINYCFGPLLLISLLSYFVIITANFYCLYKVWNTRWNTLISVIFWAFIFLELNRYLAVCCTSTTDAAHEFYNELFREVVIKKSRTFRKDGSKVSFFIKRKLKITAFGYFNIDYKFYCSMVATSVTYLIIFIQFNGLVMDTHFI